MDPLKRRQAVLPNTEVPNSNQQDIEKGEGGTGPRAENVHGDLSHGSIAEDSQNLLNRSSEKGSVLEKGSRDDLFAQDEDGNTVLHRAFTEEVLVDYDEINEEIIEERQGPGFDDIVGLIPAGSTGLNIQNNKGETALHTLLIYDDPPDMKHIGRLLELGSDIMIADEAGLTPLDYLLLSSAMTSGKGVGAEALGLFLGTDAARSYCVSILEEVPLDRGEAGVLDYSKHLLTLLFDKMAEKVQKSEAAADDKDYWMTGIDAFRKVMEDALNGPTVDDNDSEISTLQQKLEILNERVELWMTKNKSGRK